MYDLLGALGSIVAGAADAPPTSAELERDMTAGVTALESEPEDRRPRDERGRPGGLVRLSPDLPCVVVPDVHARVGLLASLLAFTSPRHGLEAPLVEALAAREAQLVFVGDYVHAEARARDRWIAALGEYEEGYLDHGAMDQEMAESLSALRFVAVLKAFLPDVVHCLKGNHENIANEEAGGNLPFGKFVSEGAMVAEYMERFYSPQANGAVYRFEKSLPLLAVGGRHIVGHAEPARFFPEHEVVDYRRRPDVVLGLTWTANDAAEPGSVDQMLAAYLPQAPAWERVYLGGHRPVSGWYHLRAGGSYVQIHNPSAQIAAVVMPEGVFDPDVDVVEVAEDWSALDGANG